MTSQPKDQGKYGLKVENLSPTLLKPNKWNPNQVSPDNEAKLLESIKRNGFFKPAIVRELADGSLELIGGEHRVRAAQTLGHQEIPVVNLGKISDKKAKELTLLDNSRYGSDDANQLAAIMGELGSVEDLASFMPYTDAEFNNIFSSATIDLDILDLPIDEEELAPPSSPVSQQSHQTMRFRLPIDDVEWVSAKLEKVMKLHGFTDNDSLTNAGDAFVLIMKNLEI